MILKLDRLIGGLMLGSLTCIIPGRRELGICLPGRLERTRRKNSVESESKLEILSIKDVQLRGGVLAQW